MPDYESYRAALAAFYRADGWFQSAENIERGVQMSNQDRRLIDALIVAGERMPRRKLGIAA